MRCISDYRRGDENDPRSPYYEGEAYDEHIAEKAYSDNFQKYWQNAEKFITEKDMTKQAWNHLLQEGYYLTSAVKAFRIKAENLAFLDSYSRYE